MAKKKKSRLSSNVDLISDDHQSNEEAEADLPHRSSNMASTAKVACASGPHFETLIKDDIFTFYIGTAKERFVVHISGLKNISEPLGRTMTNGMKEATEKEATLEHVDPQVFTQLVKFAYIGMCGISAGLSGSSASIRQLIPSKFRCSQCGTVVSSLNSFYPFCTTTCRSSRTGSLDTLRRYTNRHYSVYCVNETCDEQWLLTTDNEDLLCDTHALDRRLTRMHPKVGFEGQVIDWAGARAARSAFEFLDYGTSDLTHDQLSDHIERHLSTMSMEQDDQYSLSDHAKLYVLAHEYMVEDLQHIALHKLHRSLVSFCVFDDDYNVVYDDLIDEIIDLVLYTYSKTSDEGDILSGTADKLRSLVMAYVADQKEVLTGYKSFRAMLGAGGSQTVDFIALTCAKGK